MSKATFLLVHGSWHGPWCWELLTPELEARGHDVATVQLPSCGADVSTLGDYQADAAAVTDAAAGIADDVIVVGHSYGGAVVSEASFDERIRRLVFLAAFMPDSGRGYVSYLPPGDLPPYVGLRDDGTMAVPAGQAKPSFYADCTDEIADWAESMLTPQSQAVLAGETGTASWRTTPSTYVLAAQDRALPPDFQRMFAAQADEVMEIDSSHSPMLSRPAELADMLATVAQRLPSGSTRV